MSDNNRAGLPRSLFGSLRSHFSSRRTEDGDSAAQSPISPSASGSRSISSDEHRSHSARHPLINPSEPTRRPEPRGPPPPYTLVAGPVDTPAGSAAAARDAVRAAPQGAGAGPARVASPAPSHASSAGSSRLTADAISNNEDPYAFLTTFDTIFVIDDSGSMAGRPWREVQAVLSNITPICTAHDADGIDIYFLNHRNPRSPRTGGYHNVREAATVAQIFQTVRPGGSTPTGTRLHSILKPYLGRYAAKVEEYRQRGDYSDPDPADIKPVNVIVITDGVPTDDLEGVLVSVAQKLDKLEAAPYQVGVQFFQVGSEPTAASYLAHLDNNLADDVPGDLRDMVDTVTWDAYVRRTGGGANTVAAAAAGLTADGILKVVLGAVVKRLDRQPTGPAAAAAVAAGAVGANGPNARRFLSIQT